ncbi:MAG TPA: hypothetical protein VMT10_11455 [Solirubrobacteraceae bacterium]|nr:hypothetical protein [Solirubrobacteraceae bacterium]
MAKSDKKTAKAGRSDSRAEQVRAAVDQAFHVAGSQLTRDRAEQIADDLTSAAQRVRDALEELRPPTSDELRRVADRLEAIEKRLAALETRPPTAPPRRAAPAPSRKPAAQRKPAARRKPAG